MADEVAKNHRGLSGDLLKVELDEKVNGDDSNLNKTLPGPPVPSGKLRDRSKMGWGDNTQELDHHDLAEPQQGGGKKKDLISIFPLPSLIYMIINLSLKNHLTTTTTATR